MARRVPVRRVKGVVPGWLTGPLTHPLAPKGEHVRVLGNHRRDDADPEEVRDLGVGLVRRHKVAHLFLTENLRANENDGENVYV